MRLTKKSKSTIATILVILMIAIVACTAYLMLDSKSEGTKQTFTLYFLDSTASNFSTESRPIEVSDEASTNDEELLSLLVNELIAGPKDSVANKRSIPADTKLLSLKINESKIANVDFSKEFYAETDLENNLAVCTVVLTLCETEKVDKVAVLVDGKEIIGQGKAPLGALGKDDIVNASDPGKTATKNTITLYYPNLNADKLIKEERALQLDGGKPDATTVLNELIKGTTNTDAVNLIPASTKVLSCEIKEDTCYVNLSKDFIDKKPQGSTSETMTIDSIVHTLTEIEGIIKVTFLIEGEKIETYGQIVFNEPFERNTDIVIQ